MSNHPTHFLVIGAGPIGLACAKALKDAGLPYEQVEASDDVGGNWHHGVYETTHIISSRKTTEFPEFPMGDDVPDFPSARDMHTYYQRYTEHFGLRPNIQFHTFVTAIHPRDDGAWDVDIRGGERRVYKGVFVCNGHHWDKRWPTDTPGFDDFEGDIIHSKDYKRPTQLEGKRVLVIGGGNSGCDVAVEAGRVGVSCDISLRKGVWFLPKVIAGKPSVERIQFWMPLPLQRLMMLAAVRLIVGRYRDYGLPEPEDRIFDSHPTINTEILDALKKGRVKPRPGIQRFEGRTVHFNDGTRAEYDLVVCATGYHVSLPFLPEGLVNIQGPVAKLYGGSLLSTHKHLYIVGTVQGRYGIGPLVQPYARLLPVMARIQDKLIHPLGAVLKALGQPLPNTHLVGYDEVFRQIWLGQRLMPHLHHIEKLLVRLGRLSNAYTAPPAQTYPRHLHANTSTQADASAMAS